MEKKKVELKKPIAVFDAGIGSYAIVDLLKKAYPDQDIVYLADRANFPYGGKSHVDMMKTMMKTINYLEQYDPATVIIASNAPSVMVLDELKSKVELPLFGVYPPITEALATSNSKQVGVLGVKSMVESENIVQFIKRRASESSKVFTYNASPLVQLVEAGIFVYDNKRTEQTVKEYIDNILETQRGIDVFTLSSTHLPWLLPYFTKLYPELTFLDPASSIISNIKPYTTHSKGHLRTLETATKQYSVETFKDMLEKLHIQLQIELISF